MCACTRLLQLAHVSCESGRAGLLPWPQIWALTRKAVAHCGSRKRHKVPRAGGDEPVWMILSVSTLYKHSPYNIYAGWKSTRNMKYCKKNWTNNFWILYICRHVVLFVHSFERFKDPCITRQGPRFSIRMVIGIFYSDTLVIGILVLTLSICPTQPIFTNTETAMLSKCTWNQLQ